MPLLAKLFRRAPIQKASRVARLLAMERLGRPVWTSRDYAALAREGFMRNAVAHRCVMMVAQAAAAVPLVLYDGPRELTDHRLLRLWRGPIRVPAPAPSSRPPMPSCSSPAMPMSRPSPSTARSASSSCCGPTASRWCRGPTAGRWPMTTRVGAGTRADSARTRLRCRRSCISRSSIRSTTITAWPAGGGGDGARHAQCRRAPGTRRCSTIRRGPRARWSIRAGRGGARRRAVRPAEERAGGELPGRRPMPAGRCCWKAGSTGSRCRSPRRTGFHRGQARRRRARSRSPSACRRCCSACPATTPIANYREANRALWRQTVLPLIGRTMQALTAWLAPAFGDRFASSPTSTASRRWPRSARRCGAASAPPISSIATRSAGPSAIGQG